MEYFEYKSIGSQSDLDCLRKNGIIRYNISIKKNVSIGFKHVKRVSGGLYCNANTDFADLEFVGGDLDLTSYIDRADASINC